MYRSFELARWEEEMGPEQNGNLYSSLFAGPDKPPLISRSPLLKQLIALIKVIAARLAVVLIEGETGTGKELIARALHAQSSRHRGPFVGINCGEFADPLLESELFGHVKGAFTGAHSDKVGMVEVAHTGTLFLDEVNEMSLAMQRKVLRLLEEREVRPVGASAARKVDLAIIAASNEDLLDLVHRGRFRKDLYYRLKVAFLRVPPLRERPEDLQLLLDVFLTEYGREHRLPVPEIGNDLLSILHRHPWEGNVRELKNSIGTFFTSGREGSVDVDQIRAYLAPSPLTGQAAQNREPRRSDDPVRDATLEALERFSWKKAPAARALGISRPTLYERINRWGLRDPGGPTGKV